MFSVIIPTYNRMKFLEKAVDSVLDQSFSDFELIIVDDGSKDDTREFLDNLSDSRIKYVFQDNKGPASARNKGIEKAKNDWIAFLDSDDEWHKDKLQITKQYIEQNKDIKIFHTEEKWYRNGLELPQKKKHKKPHGWIFLNCLPLCCVSISTVVVNYSVFECVGTFDEDYPACEDYEFWLRAALNYYIYKIPFALTYKEGGRMDQLSYKVKALDKFRIQALNKILNSAYSFSEEDKHSIYMEMKQKCSIFIKGCLKRAKYAEAAEYEKLLKYAADKVGL